MKGDYILSHQEDHISFSKSPFSGGVVVYLSAPECSILRAKFHRTARDGGAVSNQTCLAGVPSSH